jgi:hypothetical protein
LGRGRNPDGDLEDFVVAIPEPASMVLVAIGLCVITASSLRFNARPSDARS